MSNTIGLDKTNYKKKSFQIITEHCAVRYNCFQRLSKYNWKSNLFKHGRN